VLLSDSSATSTPFRPDVQALRALAVGLVVLYHFGFSSVHAGFLGVDVFFVISGFVITQVLLREYETTASTSLLNFYGRRIRRILPAATAVIIATVFLTYHYLAFVTGASVATDAKWVAAFWGNFHFAAVGTDYFAQGQPPSTLQQFWSLAVEEQFYLVWPILFFALSRLFPAVASRVKLTVGLTLIIAISLGLCLSQSLSPGGSAYFSPLTRAWELAAGAVVAVLAPWMAGRWRAVGPWLSLGGLMMILFATWHFSAQTVWPGAAAIVPIVGTVAILVGGTMHQGSNSRIYHVISSFPPLQWIGAISFSLYLVHWPIITLAQQYALAPLPRHSVYELLALSIGVSVALYVLVEQPVRTSSLLVKKRALTFALGAVLIGATYAAIYWHLHNFG
jgi:peptidoglycan/LPS O-acetylase OafA/YrhL